MGDYPHPSFLPHQPGLGHGRRQTGKRASRRSAEWCLRGVNDCWKQKEKFIDQDEMEDARKAYATTPATPTSTLSTHRKSLEWQLPTLIVDSSPEAHTQTSPGSRSSHPQTPHG